MKSGKNTCNLMFPLLLVLAMASVTGIAGAAQDTTKPVINSVNVSDNAPIAGKTIIVTVNATDNSNITVVANGIPLTKQNGSIYSGSLMTVNGTHSVNVSVKDAAGNIAWNNLTSYTASLPVQPTTVATTVIVEETQAINPEPTKKKTTPGFEGFIAVIALAGLMLARKIR